MVGAAQETEFVCFLLVAGILGLSIAFIILDNWLARKQIT
jgi:hypothetical protein